MSETRFYVAEPKNFQPIRRYPQRQMYMEPDQEWYETAVSENGSYLIRVPDTLCVLLNVKGFDTE
jgi:hypothetical protein